MKKNKALFQSKTQFNEKDNSIIWLPASAFVVSTSKDNSQLFIKLGKNGRVVLSLHKNFIAACFKNKGAA